LELIRKRKRQADLQKSLISNKVKLIVDGTILEVANLNRARTQRIKRFSGKAFWGKKKRNLV
jgi:hypothetical protein